MTEKRKKQLATAAVIILILLLLWWLFFRRKPGILANNVPEYLGYNQPWGSPGSGTVAGMPSVSPLAVAPSCGCGGLSSLNSGQLFNDQSALLDYYNNTIANFANSTYQNLLSSSPNFVVSFLNGTAPTF